MGCAMHSTRQLSQTSTHLPLQAGPLGPPQDTEGLVLSLYHHLWLKDQHGQSCPVNIPHTVLFQNSQPVAWYFTSLKAGTVRACALG